MKNISLIGLTTFIIVTISFFSGRYLEQHRWKNRKRIVKEKKMETMGQATLHPKTHTAYPITENKSFVVVIPSYNNNPWCEKNIRSVLEQKYDNYRVIYLDDCSTDDTYKKVKAIVDSSEKKDRVQLIRNLKNHGPLFNHYQAISSCANDEIVVCLDGDDFFSHENVLSRLNGYYANPNVWMTYGSYLEYPSYRKGESGPIFKKKFQKKGGIRSYPWVSSHLKTFYAGLFKKIKVEDLHYQGSFFRAAGDFALMMPMLEMCGDKFLYISEILYLHNRSNPINEDKIIRPLQEQSAISVRFKDPYKPLSDLPY